MKGVDCFDLFKWMMNIDANHLGTLPFNKQNSFK